jgi:putative FmdB family regulatory protein
MPVYEFDCRMCGQPFEELVFSPARVEEVRCPTCGNLDVKKKLSAVAAMIRDGGPAAASASCTSGSL